MAEEYTPVALGLGELVVSRNPAEVLVIYGLGSCVGVGIYDPACRMAGMLHAVLPSCLEHLDEDVGRFVDSGIDALIGAMTAQGGRPANSRVWIAGGASMLGESYFDIGRKNVAIARAKLADHELTLLEAQVGGNLGRTMRIFVGEGRMTISEVKINPEWIDY
jgi:chemotaxis protein CheD